MHAHSIRRWLILASNTHTHSDAIILSAHAIRLIINLLAIVLESHARSVYDNFLIFIPGHVVDGQLIFCVLNTLKASVFDCCFLNDIL